MRKTIKVLIFSTVFIFLFSELNNVLIVKNENRYFMLHEMMKKDTEEYDVQIYGSCHAYTSFNPVILQSKYGISSYNLASPSEIFPITYLKMIEQFKRYKPKLVLIETWGSNAYDTYIEKDSILNEYLNTNLAVCPFSIEKIEVINDFDTLNYASDLFPIGRYKSRLLNEELTKLDFKYSFEDLYESYKDNEKFWIVEGMRYRFENNGFLYMGENDVSDYKNRQSSINEISKVEIEDNLLKYIDKIIALCKKNNVKCIFYRAPYVSKTVELKKANFLKEYLEDRDIMYIDLEEKVQFDYETDFNDYQHLSGKGAEKATLFLSNIINENINI